MTLHVILVMLPDTSDFQGMITVEYILIFDISEINFA